ncbi:myeloid cell surface antigen CD33-like [Hemitrygon akajei]|uniref:myeloid cell surface antigen CD33-like n=1 Tax=Hemitrygon akajei TaxID=2704970 RepID=UPI003BF9812D
MLSLRVCLCTVLLSVSVRGYKFSLNGWSMSVADKVSAVEGASAVLPCTFTHPPPDVVLNGSVIWYRESGAKKPVFKCTYPGSGPSWCDTTTQEAGGGRFGFVGNLSRRDASIMVERLNRSDGGRYRCRVELNVGIFQTAVLTYLSVRAPGESVPVLNGTEGASTTLPLCVHTALAEPHRTHGDVDEEGSLPTHRHLQAPRKWIVGSRKWSDSVRARRGPRAGKRLDQDKAAESGGQSQLPVSG